MTRGPLPPTGETAVAAGSAPAEPGRAPAALEELLGRGPSVALEANPYRFSPLISWLVTTAHPTLAVELGPGDEPSLVATCEAVARQDAGARCAAVLLPGLGAAQKFGELLSRLSDRFGDAVTGSDNADVFLADLDAPLELVHLALFDADVALVPDLASWLGALAAGGVLVVTSTTASVSPTFAEVKRQVSAEYPAVSISLGLACEAVVAQRPADDATPIVDALRRAPFAIGAFLTLFGEQIELQQLLHEQPEPSAAVQRVIGRILEQQQGEREAYVSALRVYKDETTRLTSELASARSEVSTQVEAARLERELLVREFLDRVDELSSKISTSAARFAQQLDEKDEVIEAQERRVEAYAGLAADAQAVITDMRRSTSWRLTSPVRLISRLMARRAVTRSRPRD